MENKLPDDQLEKFLRNSLNNYTEAPSQDVWKQIDSTLDQQSAFKPAFKKKWLWMVSAAAITGLMIYLALTNIYLNNKLTQALEFNKSITQVELKENELRNKELNANETLKNEERNKELSKNEIVKNEESANEMVKNEEGSKELSKNEIVKNEKSANETLKNEERSKELSKNEIVKNEESANEIVKKGKSSKEFGKNEKLKNEERSKELSRNEIVKNEESANEIVKKEVRSKNAIRKNNIRMKELRRNDIAKNEAGIKKVSKNELFKDEIKKMDLKENEFVKNELKKENDVKQARTLLQVIALTSTYNKIVLSEATENLALTRIPVIEMPIQMPIKNKWSELSVFGGSISESGSLAEERKFINLPAPPSNNFSTINSWYSGIGYSKAINKNWYVNTGIGYKSYELVNTVSQNLVYRDRNNPTPGGTPSQHDWDFILRCPGGSSNIVIQSEQLDTRAVISDNEQIKVKITNKEKLGYVAVPLSINYRTASLGKFALTAGVGMHLNILTMSHFENPSVNIDHPQLIARQDQKRDYHFDRSNDIVLNGIVTGGISYAISPKIKMQFSPSWILPLTDRNSDRDVKVKSSSYGLQLGLNYSLASL